MLLVHQMWCGIPGQMWYNSGEQIRDLSGGVKMIGEIIVLVALSLFFALRLCRTSRDD